jgi:hypothetical protein
MLWMLVLPVGAGLNAAQETPALLAPAGSGIIQVVALDATKPLFVPTHPRVTTTIRFPGEIGVSDGQGFTEDPAKEITSGNGRLISEYHIQWTQGDSYFTVVPLAGAGTRNLNVPYQGNTYVLYFYPVEKQFQAVALLNLVEGEAGSKRGIKDAGAGQSGGCEATAMNSSTVKRLTTLPASPYVPITPARLLGFMDRLKLIHATPPGPELAGMAQAMDVEVALSRAELDARPPAAPHAAPDLVGVAGVIPGGVTDNGLFQCVLLRAVRDNKLNCVGFILLLRNLTDQAIAFDVASFAARSGAASLGQILSDAPAILAPHEEKEAYFIVCLERSNPMRAGNAWTITVDLLSPRLNPGAAIARRYAQEKAQADARGGMVSPAAGRIKEAKP